MSACDDDHKPFSRKYFHDSISHTQQSMNDTQKKDSVLKLIRQRSYRSAGLDTNPILLDTILTIVPFINCNGSLRL